MRILALVAILWGAAACGSDSQMSPDKDMSSDVSNADFGSDTPLDLTDADTDVDQGPDRVSPAEWNQNVLYYSFVRATPNHTIAFRDKVDETGALAVFSTDGTQILDYAELEPGFSVVTGDASNDVVVVGYSNGFLSGLALFSLQPDGQLLKQSDLMFSELCSIKNIAIASTSRAFVNCGRFVQQISISNLEVPTFGAKYETTATISFMDAQADMVAISENSLKLVRFGQLGPTLEDEDQGGIKFGAVSFTPDGTFLAASFERTHVLFDTTSGVLSKRGEAQSPESQGFYTTEQRVSANYWLSSYLDNSGDRLWRVWGIADPDNIEDLGDINADNFSLSLKLDILTDESALIGNGYPRQGATEMYWFTIALPN